MATALCATTVVGFSAVSVNAATIGNETHAVSFDDDNPAALTDGGWHGQFNFGTKVRLYIDNADKKAVMFLNDGTSEKYNVAFISAINTYKFTDQYGKNTYYTIVSESDNHAVLICGNRTIEIWFDGVND